MNVRCCLLFGTIFVMHVSGAMQLPFPRWFVQRCKCSDLVNEVCGSDDETYSNLCKLDCASIFTPDLTLKNLGPCKIDYDYCDCPLVWDPVCGSNGLTYSNYCELTCTAEMYDTGIYVDFDGECPTEEEASTEEDVSEEVVEYHELGRVGLPCSAYSAPDRRCNATLCGSEDSLPLCGNDGNTYKNYCDFCCTYFKNPDFKIVQKGDCNTTVSEEDETTECEEETKKQLRKSGD